MDVKVSQYCFELDDMSSIAPFWDWLDRSILHSWIYTVPEDFDAIGKGQKEPDVNKFLYIGKSNNKTDTDFSLPCTYNGETTDIITADAQRLSDHRFKIALCFWEPTDWPKEFLRGIYTDLLKDLCYDYPDAKKSLRENNNGFDEEDYNDSQNLGIFETIENFSRVSVSTSAQSTLKRIAPSRSKDLNKWKATWNYIQSRRWLNMGMSPEKIREFLEKEHNKSYHGTLFSVETIEKIIDAGQAGELS
jgi:hypothetical protein